MFQRSVFGRALVSRRFLGAWLVLIATLPGGLKSYWSKSGVDPTTWNPDGKMGVNFQTYHHAAELVLDGEPFYDVPPPDTFEWAVYLYPPGTVPVFVPFTLVEWRTGYAILTGLSLVAAVAATWVLVDYVESFGERLGWIDVVLILLALSLSTHAYGTIFFGNINLFLALGVFVGFWALERNYQVGSGILFGLVAFFKIFPAIIGLWLLRRRRWRAVAAATVTGLAGLALGIVLFGVDTTLFYFTDVVSGRTETEQFVGGYPVGGTYYVTIQQPLSHLVSILWEDAPYYVIFLVSLLVVGPVLAYFYRDVETVVDRQMAIFVTLSVMLTLFPSLRWYLVFLYLPLFSLLYLWDGGYSRWLFLAGGVLFSATFSPSDALDFLAYVPEPIYSVAYPVATSAVLSFYGISLMVLACAWYKHESHGRD